MRSKLIIIAALLLMLTMSAQAQKKPRVYKGTPCGNPNKVCKTENDYFNEWGLKFEMPKNGNYDVYESKPFYAVILKSAKIKEGTENSIFTVAEKNEAQQLFPNNTVFGLPSYAEAGDLSYRGINYDIAFIGVYGGMTLVEAKKVLADVKATGKYSGAYIKKLVAEFTGT